MKTKLILGLMAVTLALSARAESVQPTVDALAWMSGRWELAKNGRHIEEVWMAPAGGTMLGMGRTVKAGRTVEFEFLILRADESGDIHYEATPSGQARTTFKLLHLEGSSVVFENKEHDFPQRIGYTLNADGSLLAYIEGPGKDGTIRRIEFPYRRVN